MSDEQRKDQADALERLARGEGIDLPLSSGAANLDERAQAPSTPSQESKPKTVRPPSPAELRPIIKPSAVPAPQLTASQSKVRPTAPVRPAAPKERPAAPTKQEPVAQPAGEQLELSSALANVIEDDAVVVPAPDIRVLARARHRPSTRRTPYLKSLHFRQTMIPVLLVLGISLPGLAIYWLTLDRDSLIRSAGPALPIVLSIAGVVMLALAILNMIAVKQELEHATLTGNSVSP